MKKLILFLFGLSVYGYSQCAPLVTDSPISGVGTPTTISISSNNLTMVPSSTTTQLSGRVGVYLALPQGNSGMVGFMGNCTSNSLASSIRPIEISTATGKSPDIYLPLREDVCLWLLSLNTAQAMQALHYQEVKK